ncbi:hypothetical protein T265_03251 [Opisthorchis viverrini]|uniref:Uncharacterized protein n=1 Tax=Opisthorchis viverrini TaxID=6198 RepID=A0A075A409_OPIVI|nr:hypothetical protein T265_03251 [Opisthorchis viverrini]KER30305.1 hypothetical protein T265_03251 [Opisthorchis viverrini]
MTQLLSDPLYTELQLIQSSAKQFHFVRDMVSSARVEREGKSCQIAPDRLWAGWLIGGTSFSLRNEI